MLNPCELEIDLFCKGMRLDSSCTLETDGRAISRTRAGLGSGLELVIPSDLKDIWVNVPVEEDFAQSSPYVLHRSLRSGSEFRVPGSGLFNSKPETRNPEPLQSYYVSDAREAGLEYAVRIPPEPAWYRRKTARGVEMRRVGVLQGTYLGIYISNSCMYWYAKGKAQNCQFCTTGYNVGMNEVADKDIEDVVEICAAAKEESGVTFVHFNSGYQNGRGLDIVAPYVKAVKERVGALIGVQMVPTDEHWKYDWLIDLGADHFSFCYEFHNPEYFARYLPGKQATVGQACFFRGMEYTAKKMGKGAVSGEIIAGVEPIEDTLKAIDYITGVGAFPTVCIFRPVIGGDMEDYPSPTYDDMRRVMAHMYEACRRERIPIGAAPNIEVSLICQPSDAKYLVPRTPSWWWYELKLALLKRLARPKFALSMRPRPIAVSDTTPPDKYRARTPKPVGGLVR